MPSLLVFEHDCSQVPLIQCGITAKTCFGLRLVQDIEIVEIIWDGDQVFPIFFVKTETGGSAYPSHVIIVSGYSPPAQLSDFDSLLLRSQLFPFLRCHFASIVKTNASAL
jgi:hypothetical protein